MTATPRAAEAGTMRPGSKATVTAPSNIAFIKYWGARDLERAVPCNPSISMTLSRCVSRTTVEVRPAGERNEILLLAENGELSPAPTSFRGRIEAHLDRLRRWAGRDCAFRVATHNSFPASAGLASSASGFAALTVAVTRALDLSPSSEELSTLARLSGSGSASRSVLGGYVEWPGTRDELGGRETEESLFASSLAPAEHWDLRDVIAVIETGPKEVSSLDGHRRAATSPYFEVRQQCLEDRLRQVRDAIAARDFASLGPVIEEEAIDLHLIAMSSRPAIYYWSPGTLEVLATVRGLRREGIAAYSTMDAGANVHVICPPESEDAVVESLTALTSVHQILRDRVGTGPATDPAALF